MKLVDVFQKKKTNMGQYINNVANFSGFLTPFPPCQQFFSTIRQQFWPIFESPTTQLPTSFRTALLLTESRSHRRLYLIEPWFSYRVLFSFKDDRWLGTSSLPPLCMEVDMSVPIEFKGAAKQPATAHCKFLWISVRFQWILHIGFSILKLFIFCQKMYDNQI